MGEALFGLAPNRIAKWRAEQRNNEAKRPLLFLLQRPPKTVPLKRCLNAINSAADSKEEVWSLSKWNGIETVARKRGGRQITREKQRKEARGENNQQYNTIYSIYSIYI